MSLPVKKVSTWQLQKIFNDADYVGRVERGELLAVVESTRPARPEAGQVEGTASQMVWYFDASLRRVALVHQYVQPDGAIGASGKPDPKRPIMEGEILIC